MSSTELTSHSPMGVLKADALSNMPFMSVTELRSRQETLIEKGVGSEIGYVSDVVTPPNLSIFC